VGAVSATETAGPSRYWPVSPGFLIDALVIISTELLEDVLAAAPREDCRSAFTLASGTGATFPRRGPVVQATFQWWPGSTRRAPARRPVRGRASRKQVSFDQRTSRTLPCSTGRASRTRAALDATCNRRQWRSLRLEVYELNEHNGRVPDDASGPQCTVVTRRLARDSRSLRGGGHG
jgi:hypothetical protein